MGRTNHDHEWELDHVDPAEYHGEDLFVYEHCNWVEITGSAHSAKHDETFYEEGATCEATRTTVFSVSEPVRQSDGEVIEWDQDDVLSERIDMALSDVLTGSDYSNDVDPTEPRVVSWWHYSGVDKVPHHVTVTIDGEEYWVNIEYEKQSVEQE